MSGWDRAGIAALVGREARRLALRADYGREWGGTSVAYELAERLIDFQDRPLYAHLARTEAFIRRYVVLSDEQAAAVALWVAHTHAFEAAAATPYLAISSAEMESGKTRLIEALELLVANPWFTSHTTAAALTRKIDLSTPTLLLDESDAAFGGDKAYAETLRGVLNAGHRRGGAVTVCAGQGAQFTVKDLGAFCPKAIAGIGSLPDTVASRSIPIRLKKRKPAEQIERFHARKAAPSGDELHDALAAALEPLLDQLRDAEPPLPDELSDRAQDVWEPLLAIADLAGGPWPDRARTAAVRLSGRLEPDEATLGVRLLGDVREAFGGEDRLKSAALLTALHAVEEAPWGEYHGKPLSAQKLAKLLRPFEIKPTTIWLEGKAAKGYKREDFGDAWARYLPASPAPSRKGRKDGLDKPGTAAPGPLGATAPNGTGKGGKPLEQADLTGLTATGQETGAPAPDRPNRTLEDELLDPAAIEAVRASVDGEWVEERPSGMGLEVWDFDGAEEAERFEQFLRARR